MTTVIFNKIMSTIVQLAKIVKIQQASTIDGYDIQIEWILLNRLKTYLICPRNIALTMCSLGLNAVNIDVVLDD